MCLEIFTERPVETNLSLESLVKPSRAAVTNVTSVNSTDTSGVAITNSPTVLLLLAADFLLHNYY